VKSSIPEGQFFAGQAAISDVSMWKFGLDVDVSMWKLEFPKYYIWIG